MSVIEIVTHGGWSHPTTTFQPWPGPGLDFLFSEHLGSANLNLSRQIATPRYPGQTPERTRATYRKIGEKKKRSRSLSPLLPPNARMEGAEKKEGFAKFSCAPSRSPTSEPAHNQVTFKGRMHCNCDYNCGCN